MHSKRVYARHSMLLPNATAASHSLYLLLHPLFLLFFLLMIGSSLQRERVVETRFVTSVSLILYLGIYLYVRVLVPIRSRNVMLAKVLHLTAKRILPTVP